MTYRGKVINGAVVLNGGIRLPEGADVQVQVAAESTAAVAPPPSGTLAARLLEIAGTIDGPADLAENHDHYLYGTPKQP